MTSPARRRNTRSAAHTRDRLLAIAEVVGGVSDLTEALRLVCRELVRLTGADTAVAHLLDRERNELRPVAGYHLPEPARPQLARPVSAPSFWPAIVESGDVVWSDDVAHDERFACELSRAVPHRSGVVIPLVADGDVAGTCYLAWWTARRRVAASEAAMLRTIGRQVGRLVRNAWLVEDAERRRGVEHALREREAQLRQLGNNLPDGVIYQVIRRPDGSNTFPYMSAGLERTFGVSAAEAIRDANLVYRLIVPEDLEIIRAAGDESIRTGEPMDVEYRLRAVDGTHRWLNLRARPSRLPDGSTQWDAVALDITERKRVDEIVRQHETQLRALADDLRRSEERYRLLFERSFVGIFRTRWDGMVMDCNDAFARILGYGGAAEVRGRSVVPHYATPADRDMVVAKIAAGEDVVEAELVGRRLDGSLVPVAMSVRRIVEPDGPIHEGTLIDLTDRKRAEEAVALRSVAELANAAAHEINNPLAVVVGQLAMIEKGRDVAEGIRRVRTAALRIRDIVNHMTRITRLEWPEAASPSLPRMLDLRRSGAADDAGRGSG